MIKTDCRNENPGEIVQKRKKESKICEVFKVCEMVIGFRRVAISVNQVSLLLSLDSGTH